MGGPATVPEQWAKMRDREATFVLRLLDDESQSAVLCDFSGRSWLLHVEVRPPLQHGSSLRSVDCIAQLCSPESDGTGADKSLFVAY